MTMHVNPSKGTSNPRFRRPEVERTAPGGTGPGEAAQDPPDTAGDAIPAIGSGGATLKGGHRPSNFDLPLAGGARPVGRLLARNAVARKGLNASRARADALLDGAIKDRIVDVIDEELSSVDRQREVLERWKEGGQGSAGDDARDSDRESPVMVAPDKQKLLTALALLREARAREQDVGNVEPRRLAYFDAREQNILARIALVDARERCLEAPDGPDQAVRLCVFGANLEVLVRRHDVLVSEELLRMIG